MARVSSANVVAVASVGAPTARDASIASKMDSVIAATAAPTRATNSSRPFGSGSDATTRIAAARFAAVPAAYRVVVAASGAGARFAVDAATRRIVRLSAKSTSNPTVGSCSEEDGSTSAGDGSSSAKSSSSSSSSRVASASACRASPLTLTTHPAAATRAPASSPSTSAATAARNPGAFAIASRPSGASARFLAAPAAASRHSGTRDRARRVKPAVHPDARAVDANADADDLRDARFPIAVAACAAADARARSESE